MKENNKEGHTKGAKFERMDHVQYTRTSFPTGGHFNELHPHQSNWDLLHTYERLSGVEFRNGGNLSDTVSTYTHMSEIIRKSWGRENYDLQDRTITYDELVTPYYRSQGMLLGLFCGDAIGRPIEFMSPERIQKKYGRVTDMIGDGTHSQKAGTLTDDSDQAIRLIDNIIEHDGFNQEKFAEQLVEWHKSEPFDVGITTSNAINNLRDGVAHDKAGHKTLEELGPNRAAGNGSIMRCAPLAIAYPDDTEALIDKSIEMSEITHADPRCTYGCAALNLILAKLIREGNNNPIEHALNHLPNEAPDELIDVLETVKSSSSIDPDTSGYVLSTLKTALYAGLNCNNPENGILVAINQGGDADTIGAITGAIAGARFGGNFRFREREYIRYRIEDKEIAEINDDDNDDLIPKRWTDKIKLNIDGKNWKVTNFTREKVQILLERPQIAKKLQVNK